MNKIIKENYRTTFFKWFVPEMGGEEWSIWC